MDIESLFQKYPKFVVSFFSHMPIMGHMIKKFNIDSKDSLGKAIHNFLKKTGSRIIINGLNSETKKILKKERVILVSNHPFESEVLFLLSVLPYRSDLFLISNANIVGFFPDVDKHIIPVYIQHHIVKHSPSYVQGKILRMLNPVPKYSPEEEHIKNRESIQNAADKVSEGGLVVLFPGRRGVKGKWFDGISYLIKGVKTKKPFYLIKAHCEGSSNWDYFRIIPGLSKLLKPITITFSPPIALMSYQQYSPKVITSKLEASYKKWSQNI